jgi:hypothetical protein
MRLMRIYLRFAQTVESDETFSIALLNWLP